jgi:flagellar biosynthesis protein FliQ
MVPAGGQFGEGVCMTPEFITGFFFEAVKTAISLSAPMLLAGLAVGLLVSIFQAVTSINEMTLTFIPKMLAVAVALIFFFPWMMQTMIVFTTNLFENIMFYVR